MSTASYPVTILGTGSSVPARIVSNEELSRTVATSDEWIASRTGIRERRIAQDDETTSEMGARAAAAAIAASGITTQDIDAVLACTMTPDMPFPSTACLIQQKLGLPRRTAFDIQAACSGFIYGLEVAASLIQAGVHRHVLLIGSERLSSIIDWKDRSTCVLFGDGAGAVVLGRGPSHDSGVLGVRTGADGSDAQLLYMPGGGSTLPATADSVASGQHFLRMNGREVYKHAILVMEEIARDLLHEHGVLTHEIDLVIPHQANLRILDTLADRLEIPMEKFFVNLDRYGNTSAASIPIAIDEAARGGRLRPGQLVLFLAFGAGLTWGAALVRWHGNK
ncbi:MAG: beta-ketoacyl-ACP synthase III [Opitutaceae bacterium]